MAKCRSRTCAMLRLATTEAEVRAIMEAHIDRMKAEQAESARWHEVYERVGTTG